MLTDWELWACAATVERQHGNKVSSFIAERIGELAQRGDRPGVETWQAIALRLEQMNGSGFTH